jgi:hypothetical protein
VGEKMVGVLYIFLLFVAAMLYVKAQFTLRMFYIGHLAIFSMALVGLLAFLDADWQLFWLCGLVTVVWMLCVNSASMYMNRRQIRENSESPYPVRWTAGEALFVLLGTIIPYALFIAMSSVFLGSSEPRKTVELIVWAIIIVVCLLCTYTKQGARVWAKVKKSRSRK